MLITWESKRKPGPEVRIKCPNCKKAATADTYAYQESMGVFYIPLVTTKETRVECSNCQVMLVTLLPLSKLAGLSPQQISSELRVRNSFLAKFVAVCSVLLCYAPFLGVILGGVGLAMNYRTGRWPKLVSIVGLVLGLIATIASVAYLIFGEAKAPR